MARRVFIIHGWDGTPQEGWFPWLKQQLEERGFQVYVPQMPEANKPRIQNWVPALAAVVGTADKDSYFIGHSMGAQTIARYLESLPDGVRVGGAVFVAGFFKRLTGLENDADVQATDRHWLEAPIDLKKVAAHMRASVALFSDNDPYVPLDNQDDFRKEFHSLVIVLHHMGHFSGSDGIKELPVALEALVSITS